MIKPQSEIPEEYKDIGQEVLDCLALHEQLLGLTDWTIKVFWKPVEDHYVMETVAQPEYYKAHISVDLPELEREHIAEYVRHELFHVLMWHYTEAINSFLHEDYVPHVEKLEERVVSDLERLPLWEKIYEAIGGGKDEIISRASLIESREPALPG